MLKRMVLMTVGVFGAASMAVAGIPITAVTVRPMTVKPETHGSGGTSAPVSVTNPRLAPSIRRIVPGITVAPVTNRRRLPDLVIRTAVIRPAQGAAGIAAIPACRSGAPVLYVTARIQNIGHGPSTAKPSVGMVQARVAGGMNWGNGHGLPALAPGAMASVTFPIYYLQSNPGYMHGSHTFKLTVNAGKWVHESNYANNGFRPVKVTLPPGFCGRPRLSPIPPASRLTGAKSRTPPNLRFDGYQPGLPNKCADLHKLMVIRASVFNNGGPLSAHRAKIYLRETNGAHLYSPEIPIPPLAHNRQVDIAIPVGTTEAYRGKLPDVHHLNSYLVEDGKVTKSINVSFAFPKGYCQPKTGSATHGEMPDLIPQVSNPFNGVIVVKNIGGATAGASKLTVNCKKLGGGPGGDCPSTPALNSLPTDASGALLESVPALNAGQVYTISLPVQGLKWDRSKDYRFTYKADATHAVAESNEVNNKLVMRIANLHKIGGSATHGPARHGLPDLIPQVSDPFNGIIKVKNIGAATAGASKLAVNCKKLGGGFAASAGDCPSTPALNSLPTDSSGALLESVPALKAGRAYTISLPVQGLTWAKGKYRFTYKADATHAVAESNESNNVKTMVRQR